MCNSSDIDHLLTVLCFTLPAFNLYVFVWNNRMCVHQQVWLQRHYVYHLISLSYLQVQNVLYLVNLLHAGYYGAEAIEQQRIIVC
jgi:hypothetical protein